MLKKYVVLIAGILTLSLCVAGTYFYKSTNASVNTNNISVYNENPDVSKKVVGSNGLFGFRIPAESMDDITKFADLVVVGTVISKPVDYQIDFPFPNEEMKQNALKGSKEAPKITLACSKIRIEETLHGKAKGNEITLAQLGNANSNDGETKVINGQKYLFILKNHPDNPDMFSSTTAEEGIFKIGKSKIKNSILGIGTEKEIDSTTSLSDNKFTSRYDGITLDTLKKDVKNAKKKNQ